MVLQKSSSSRKVQQQRAEAPPSLGRSPISWECGGNKVLTYSWHSIRPPAYVCELLGRSEYHTLNYVIFTASFLTQGGELPGKI
jgi:hypothetical protein